MLKVGLTGGIASGKTTVTASAPEEGYAAWALSWGVDIGDGTNDYDGDFANNFYEYALNGDPTNGMNTGELPLLETDGFKMLFIHVQRNDDESLDYQVQTAANLISNTWAGSGYTVLGTNSPGGVYDYVTNSIETDKEETFVRLNVTQD